MGRWGFGLFQSDLELDLTGDMALEIGLHELQEEVRAGREGEDDDHYYLDLYAPCCADPDIVRNYLDEGILEMYVEDKEEELLTRPLHSGSGYFFVLFGVCAMSLGCTLPDSYIATLKKVYDQVGGFYPEAQRQLHKALFGPDGFQNGIPYDFDSKGLVETANELGNREKDDGNPYGPEYTMSDSSASEIIKNLRDQYAKHKVCGNCEAKRPKRGKELRLCGRCRDRRYCSAACQKKHWKVHKTTCKPVEE